MADTPTGSGSNGGTTTVVANPPNPPTTNTVPNTTTDTKTVQYQSAATEHVFDPRQDVAESVFDPSLGSGVGPPQTESVFDPRQDPEEHVFNPDAALPNPAVTTAAQLNDPLAGLTPAQLKDLGGADPTDPYIRARLGIPQLPGSTLNATPGFGFGNLTTNLPSIDGALGTIKGLFSGVLGGGTGGGAGLSSLFNNFSATVGGLFGGTPTASAAAATTGSGTAALVAPAGPATTLSKVDATTTEGFGVQAPVDPTTTEGFGVQATVDPTTLEGYGIQATVDPTTLEGYGVPAGTNNTTLTAKQTDAVNAGTGTPTTAQVQAQDQQLAADAAKLYPGTQNKALLNIDKGYAAIEENTAGIANAEKIVAANNAELADPATSDARRAELLANNDAQQQYIQVATENSAIQQNVIEQNANVYAAGGGNEGDGQSPDQVSALADPAVGQTPVDPTTTEGFGVQAPVDPTTLEGYGIQATVDPTTTEGFGVQAPVDPTTLEGYGVPPTENEINAQIDAMSPEPVTTTEEENQAAVEAAIAADQTTNSASAVDPTTLEGYGVQENGATATPDPNFGFNPDQEAAASEAAIREQAKQQATYKARYGDVQRTPDWRVRLSLAPGAQYLYNDPSADVLKPLSASSGTNGVIFPYTPSITTTYSANYEQYDLVHSNYRGLFYKNSRVGDVQIRGTFTAQDTQEANYLLAVIHFFRSATKMFYGQDAQRGAPPPICFLNGLGQYQFSNHPVVISSFNYTLPNDVDYIRTSSPNNFGLNLLDRYNQTPGPSRAGSGPLAGVVRLANALLTKGAQPPQPGPYNPVPGMVNNQTPASYVPTKMEIDITLIPVQTRSQLSKTFSLQGFANGDLLRGGFW